jgi:hypothetical protein
MSRFAVILTALLLLLGCRAERGDPYPPVTTAQFAGCHYSPEASGGAKAPRFQWSFEPDGFQIVAGADPIPPALLEAILGTGASAKKVEGRWAIDGRDLRLSELKVDGKAVSGTSRLEVWNTGVIRVSLPTDLNAEYAFSR